MSASPATASAATPGGVGAPRAPSSTPAPSAFLLPPVVHNARGQVRKAGFELEYSGVSLEVSAIIVRHVFGGRDEATGPFTRRVRFTRYGEFKLYMDSTWLKQKEYEKPLRAVGLDPARMKPENAAWVERAAMRVAAAVGIPAEIVTPPVPVTELDDLDEMRRLLRQNGAAGTRASLHYVFGMHINAEIPREDPAVLRDYLRAVVLLYPDLKERAQVAFSRRLSPYIDPFPEPYARLILRDDYPADLCRLIDDYLEHNPTRNRPLDMLPALAHLDRDRVMRRVVQKDLHLVQPRPAFHYRLPNCMVDEEGWTLAKEWNDWVDVERLANDPDRLARMSRQYLNAK